MMPLRDNVINSGLSFVVCCHNSALRINKVLHYIAAQDMSKVPNWEVLVVDNASIDNTAKASVEFWKQTSSDSSQLRIVSEPRLGIGHARYRGVREAAYEFICFVDDDNWVAPDYAKNAYEFMICNPKVAACGSLNEIVSEEPIPDWFYTFQRSYAVGPQFETGGDVTKSRGVLWSAGMVLRKLAVMDLFDAGFEPLITGAQKDSRIMRSEDYELCLALCLRGWSLWYLPDLKLQHHVFGARLSWQYLRKLLESVGMWDPCLYPYYVSDQLKYKSNIVIWLKYALMNVLQIIKNPVVFIFHPLCLYEGKKSVLTVVRSVGCLQILLRERGPFLKALDKIRDASWILDKKAT